MAVVAAMHRPDQADVIDDPGDVREQFGDLGTTLAVLLELPATSQQSLTGALDETVLHVTLVSLPIHPLEFRLGIGQGHGGGPPVHEQGDHGPGLGIEVRLLGRQVKNLLATGDIGGRGQQLVVTQERGQGDASHSHCVLGKELSSTANRGPVCHGLYSPGVMGTAFPFP